MVLGGPWAVLGELGGALGRPRGSWGVRGSAVGRPWDTLGEVWGPREPFGTSLGVLESRLVLLGIPLGRFGWF